MLNQTDKIMLGWREWAALPDLGLPAIKAKVDTGAKTSALHAYYTARYRQKGVDLVRFLIHPIQKNDLVKVECVAPVIDVRQVSDSGGHKEMRVVIESMLSLGDKNWPIELTLTNRDTMRFRMLLGRSAMNNMALVDPAASYMNGRLNPHHLYGL